MASLAEYFNNLPRYKPKWKYGSRVFGHWKKIPFVGIVIADREKDHILVHVDLPIFLTGVRHDVIIVKHKDITLLKEF
jgi:hypothetical protein